MLMRIPFQTNSNVIPVHAGSKQELNKIIGRNVALLQKATGLTQAEFLEIIGFKQKYPQSYFQKLARGEVGIHLYTLLIIQKTFQVSLEDLITYHGES